jgi:hypothetical protein
VSLVGSDPLFVDTCAAVMPRGAVSRRGKARLKTAQWSPYVPSEGSEKDLTS